MILLVSDFWNPQDFPVMSYHSMLIEFEIWFHTCNVLSLVYHLEKIFFIFVLATTSYAVRAIKEQGREQIVVPTTNCVSLSKSKQDVICSKHATKKDEQ